MRKQERGISEVGLIVWGLIAFLFLGAISMYGCPKYEVWQQGLKGQAELARAEQNRKIRIQEAQATLDSASLLAQAEAKRAEGVAMANEIIGESLTNNEAYLRYLWIQGMQTNEMQVVYVPTEANLPIMEASRWSLAAAQPPSVIAGADR